MYDSDAGTADLCQAAGEFELEMQYLHFWEMLCYTTKESLIRLFHGCHLISTSLLTHLTSTLLLFGKHHSSGHTVGQCVTFLCELSLDSIGNGK